MSETRRQLFKASILSAFGLTACASPFVKPTVVGANASDPQSTGMLVYTSAGWIYLDPTIDSQGNVEYYSAYKFNSSATQITQFDLAKVAKTLTGPDLAPAGNVAISGTSVTLAIQDNGKVNLPAGLVQFTWNEIGSRQFS